MQIDRNHTIFVYDRIKIFFKHTDYHGFVHPYNYLEWMSYAREAFFNKILPSYRFDEERPTVMVTVKMQYSYRGDARFGDDIDILIFTEHVRRFSFDVVFEFYVKKDNKMIGVGKQTIAFLQRETHKPASIPDDLYLEIKKGERKNGNQDA